MNNTFPLRHPEEIRFTHRCGTTRLDKPWCPDHVPQWHTVCCTEIIMYFKRAETNSLRSISAAYSDTVLTRKEIES